ncbi:MAG: restriction endonuclease subunit S [Methylococcaceae bacterium]|nr:MAG: restriction endonuclease subunit S [Methylococcaceae bacterium]
MSAIRAGYKQTEVGVIPEDWEVSKLSAIGEIIRGASPRPKGDKRYYGGDIPRLMVEDVTRDGKFVVPQIDFLTTEGAKKSRPCKKGTLTIVCSGTVGVVAFLGVDACIHDGFLALVGVSRLVSDDYIFHQLSALRERFDSSATHGGVFTNLTTTGVKEFAIPLPPTKAEQEAIAEALSDADALIESLEQLLAKKHHLKQGAMQELLTGKKRLPGFSGEWSETTLFDLAQGKKEFFDDGDWVESEHITTDGVRLIQTGNIGVGQYIEKAERKYIFEASFSTLRCKEIREGDLLICRLADPAGRACVLPNIGEGKIITSVDVTIFRPPTAIANRVFLANTFSTDEWLREVSDRSGGTTHKRISRGALGRLKIKVPSLPEQEAIAAILVDMDAEIAELESQLTKTRTLKQGMMQKLLTGEIRLV